MKRTFGECFGEDDGSDEDLLEEEEEDWKVPVIADEDDGVGHDPKAKRARHQDGNSDHQRTIVHIDLDCFYAQVEMIRNPSLRDKPLGVQQKNIVVTTNYVAREYGVGKLSYIKDAIQKCPELVLVSGEDLTHYREMSYKVTEILQRFDPTVERLGFDENFINVSSLVEERLNLKSNQGDKMAISGHIYKDESIPACFCGCHQRLAIGSHIAMEMRRALHRELGLTSCAGVAHNKLLAKLVGSQHKPSNQTTLFPEYAEQLMLSLGKVRGIPGIGHSTGKRLASMGISTVQHLLDASETVLEAEFGHQQAVTMQQLAHGVDNTPVTATGAPQSLSDEDSFKKCGSFSDAKQRMLGLLENLLKRLKSDGRLPQTIRVTVRKYSPKEWKRESRQCSLALSIFKSFDKDEGPVLNKLLDVCIGLFQKMVDTTKSFHLTLINICFAKMQSNSKTSSGSIDNFFTPKAASSGTLTKLSEASSEPSCNTDISDAKAFHSNTSGDNCLMMTETSCVKEKIPDEKEKPKTLEAFFSSPKREKTKTSQLRKEENCGSVNLSAQDASCKRNSLDRFLPKESSRTTFLKEKTRSTVPCPIFKANRSSSVSKEHQIQSSGSAAVNVEFGESLSNNLSDVTVPPNIDPDVFAQLPSDLQQELRTEFASSLSANNFANSVADCNQSGVTHRHQEDSVSGPTSGSIGSTSSTDPTSSTTGSTSDTCATCPTSTSSGPTSTCQTKLPDVTVSESGKPQPILPPASAICIPPDVDPEVFAGLPCEMQQELANEWKRKANQSNQTSVAGAGYKPQRLSREKVKQKGRSISDYFKK